MKKNNYLVAEFILLFSFLFVYNHSCFSQSEGKIGRYEVGLGLAYLPFNVKDYSAYYPNISLKYALERNVFRSGISVNNFDFNKNSESSFLGNIGYERRFFDPKFQLLLGVDLCYLNTQSSYSDHFNNRYYSSFKNYGLGPVLGLMYQFSPRFSFQTECGFFWGYGKNIANGNVDNMMTGWNFTTSQRFLSLHFYYNFEK